MTLEYFFVMLFGVLFGSFANVVIFRDDKRKSILTGRSECPSCKHVLTWYELIPVLSYLIQGGRCRSCKNALSVQYPLVEIGMGVLFALAYSISNQGWVVFFFLAVAFFFFFVSAIIDLRTQFLPIEYVVIAGVTGALGQFFLKISLQDIGLGILVGAGSLALVRIIWFLAMKQEGMGEGDIWLGGALGAFIAYPSILVALVSAIFIGAIVGSLLAIVQKKTLGYAIPFGPFLLLGTIIAIFWGEMLIRWYTTLI